MATQLTLAQALRIADEVIVDGYTFEARYDEIQLNFNGTAYKFYGGGEMYVLPDQALEEIEPYLFSALTEDGDTVELTFVRVERDSLTTEEMLPPAEPEAA